MDTMFDEPGAGNSERVGRDDPSQRIGFLRAALANSSDLLVVIDEHADLTFVSAASQRILGRAPTDWIGRNVFELLHPDDATAAAESLVTSVDSGVGVKDPIEVRVRHADGTWREVEIVANNLLHDPEVAGILINARDVSERHESRRRIQHANRRFELAFARSPIGMALTSLDGCFARVNQAMCDLVGRSAPELLTMSIFDVVHDADVEPGIRAGVELLEGNAASFSMEQRFLHAGGRNVWTRSTVTVLTDDDDRPEHFLVQIEDVEERRRLMQQLRRSALVDPLTSLANRAGFAEHVQRLPPEALIGVIAIDLDRFKRINDESGHSAGDAVLQEVARRIDAQTRREDLAARMGGDEFVIVCADPGEERLLATAHRIVDRIAQPIDLPDGVRYVGASAGVAIGRAQEADSLLNAADEASYTSKRSGGNSVVVAA
ncbi:MAG: diguanylate cyclase domain-containing protein [Microthrixaceae bacterium]